MFKTAALDHSANPPKNETYSELSHDHNVGVYSTLLSVFVSPERLSSMLWVGLGPTVQLFIGLLWFDGLVTATPNYNCHSVTIAIETVLESISHII